MRIITITLFLLSFTAGAQIVNIENKRLSGKDEGFDGNIDLNLNFTMNTRQLLQIGNRMKFGYRKNQHHTFILTDLAFVKSNNDDFVNRGYAHLRYNYTLKDSGRVTLEIFQQGQFNRIQKINLRLLTGTGFRFNLIDQKNYQLSIGSGFMGEYEELIDDGLSRDILSTSYLSFDGQFSENVGVNTISYFQPKMIDFGNYRFSNETQLRFSINKYLSYKIIYSLTHDSRNLQGVRKTNYILKNTLSFKF
jgi:putative salt-induced outer membrane protein YdiY